MSNPLLLVPSNLKYYNFNINPDHGEYPELVITGLTKERLQETKDIILRNQFEAFKYKKLTDELYTYILDYENAAGCYTPIKDLKEIMRMYL